MIFSTELERIKGILYMWYMNGSDKEHLTQLFNVELTKRHLQYDENEISIILDIWIKDEFY
jgi:hypothetical protein